MATYLQGVTDYIPQVQPFQPNMNLYANVLQQKQTKYDQNWESINNVYSQLIYADLSREDNQERRDELVKAIDFNLKKVSGLDLSLQQNTRQAKQLFTPFYEDKFLMKDIAWTKNFTSEASRALSLKNSKDEKQRAQYWDTGMRGMDYRKQEFTEADLQDTLNFGNARYTSYVNTSEKALDIAKKAGLSIESVEFSPDGRWIIKNTNGEKLKEPLSKLFMATVAKDPAVQAVYQEQAYVNRKDYASVNASMFGGDKKQAEIRYLSEQLDNQALKTKMKYDELNDRSRVYTNQINKLQKQLDNNTAKPGTQQLIAELKSNQQINDTALGRWNEVLEQLKGSESSTANTSNGFRNPYGDLETLRRKVDGAVANELLYKDVNEAAETFAYRNHKQDIEANPYKVMEIKHQNAVSLERMRAESRRTLLEDKQKAEKAFEWQKEMVKAGVGTFNNKGEFSYIPGYDEVREKKTRGSDKSTPLMSYEEVKTLGEDQTVQTSMQVTKPIIDNLYQLLRDGQNEKGEPLINEEDIRNILGLDLETFNSKYNDRDWILKNVNPGKLAAIWTNYNKFMEDSGAKLLSSFDKNQHMGITRDIDAFTRSKTAHDKWVKEVNDGAIKALTKEPWTGFAAPLDAQKDKVLSIFMDIASDANIPDNRNFMSWVYREAPGKDSKVVKDFTNRLIKEGLILPDLQQAAAKTYSGRRATGSQFDYAWENHKNEIAQTYKNPSTGRNFSNAIEYVRYQRENFGSEAKYQDYGHKILTKLKDRMFDNVSTAMSSKTHPLLPSFGLISNNSMTQINGTTILAAPQTGTIGDVYARDVLDDLTRNVDFDRTNNQYSIYGSTITGLERSRKLDKSLVDAGYTQGINGLVGSIVNDMKNGYKDLNHFSVDYNDISESKLGKESITLNFSKDDLEKWRKNTENLESFGIDEAQSKQIIESIITNGITASVDDGAFNNNFARSSKLTAFEKAVAVSDDPFIIRDTDNSKNSITYTKHRLEPNNFVIDIELNAIDPVTNKEFTLVKSQNVGLNTTSSLDAHYNEALETFNLVNSLPNIYAQDKNLYAMLLQSIIQLGYE